MKSSQSINMKSLNKIKQQLSNNKDFDLLYESQMVQSRIISSILEVIEEKKYTQQELEELTGLSQPFLSGLFNNRKKLNVEHIAKFQNALNIVLQPPKCLSKREHTNTYYVEDNYDRINEFSNCLSKEIKDNYAKTLNHLESSYKIQVEYTTLICETKKENKYEYA